MKLLDEIKNFYLRVRYPKSTIHTIDVKKVTIDGKQQTIPLNEPNNYTTVQLIWDEKRGWIEKDELKK